MKMNNIRMITLLHNYGYSHRQIDRMIAWNKSGVTDDR